MNRQESVVQNEKFFPEEAYFQIVCAVLDVDALTNLVTFDFVLFFIWTPPNATKNSEASNSFIKADVRPEWWKPDPSFYNIKTKTTMEESFYVNKQSGTCACLLNWIMEVSETLELQRFPYDRQFLKIAFHLPMVRLVPSPKISETFSLPSTFPHTPLVCIVDLGNWNLEDASVQLIYTGEGHATSSGVNFKMQLSRDPSYYLWNIVLVIFVLVLAAFSVVGVPFNQYSDRMSITMTLLLTIVAFKFVIATYVPPTSYLTLLDKYLLSAFILMGTVVLENFIVSYASAESALAEYIDAAFAFVLFLFWVLFHIFVVVGTHFNWFYLEWDIVEKLDGESRKKDSVIRKEQSDIDILDRRTGVQNQNALSTRKQAGTKI